MRVAVPTVDLRNAPTDQPLIEGKKDLRRESQLLFFEEVRPLARWKEWLYVEAVEQPHAQGGYRGWVALSSLSKQKPHPQAHLLAITARSALGLSFGTILPALAKEGGGWRVAQGLLNPGQAEPLGRPARSSLIPLGCRLLGLPYLWGGRSSLTGLDCSGLVQLLYRVAGYRLPRNAKEQFLQSAPLDGRALETADLLFMAPKPDPAAIDHVLLYAGEGELLEATMASETVRLISVRERFGCAAEELCSGEWAGTSVVWLGRPDLT